LVQEPLLQGLSPDDFAPAGTNNGRTVTIRHDLVKVSLGHPQHPRRFLQGKGINGSILQSRHPAHLITSVASHRLALLEHIMNKDEVGCTLLQDKGSSVPAIHGCSQWMLEISDA
jgi:hypothetical protein